MKNQKKVTIVAFAVLCIALVVCVVLLLTRSKEESKELDLSLIHI